MRVGRPFIFLQLLLAFLLTAMDAGATVLRVASWNIRNYTSTDRYLGKENGGWVPEYPKPESEKTALRMAILEIRPDVVVFQEIGPEAYLEELRLDLARQGLTYPYSASMQAADPDRCLGVLSMIPFAEVHRVTDLEFSVSGSSYPVKRGLLALDFVTDGVKWTLYDTHIKSRVSKAAEAELNGKIQLGEANAIRNRIQTEQAADDFWILAGDTNSSPGSSVWKRLTSKSGRKLGIDLRPVDSKGEYWTYYYSKQDTYERLDILLASASMERQLVPASPRIYDGENAMKASDHRMIFADFDFTGVAKQSSLPIGN